MENLKKYTILVVDDEEILRDSIIFDLKRKGFSVLSAECGNKAIDIVKSNEIHLVVSDIRMPSGDGMFLLDRIKALDPTIPTVILVTGFSDVSNEECIRRGARTVLQKPFERKDLMNNVFSALNLPYSI